jgi:hypothetical protein
LAVVTSASILFVNRNVDINLATFFKIIGIEVRPNSQCRGGAGRGGICQGRVQKFSSSANAAKRGICTNLGTNVFDYSQKSAADQMHTSWEKLAHYVETNYGQDINN